MTMTSPRTFVPRLAMFAGVALLAGCTVLGGRPRTATTIYAPEPRVPAQAAWPTVRWQLSLSNPTAARMIDTARIAVRPTPNEIEVYKGAGWAKRPSDMLEDTVLRTLEDSGKISTVARQGSGISADYKLVLDLRRFESDYGQGTATPAATIEVSAKLLHAQDQQVVAARTFQQARPASTTAVADVVAAFEQSLAAISGDIAGWTLTSGDSHDRDGHRQGR